MMHDPTRRVGALILASAAVLGLDARCTAGPPSDPVGTWKLCYVCPDGKARRCLIIVTREGQRLRASCDGEGGKRPARSVTFEDGILSVKVGGEFAGAGYELTYKGTIEGDTLRGDVGWSYLWASGSFAFEGERVVEEEAEAS